MPEVSSVGPAPRPGARTIGRSKRGFWYSAAYDSRPASHIQKRFTSGLARGTMRWMRLRKVPTFTLQPRAQATHTDGTFFRNQTRALKRNGFQVRAPTGQTSTVQPE